MSDEVLTIERCGHVLLMGLNRPNKYNAVTLELFHALAHAYGNWNATMSCVSVSCLRTGHTLPPALTCSSGRPCLQAANSRAGGRRDRSPRIR